MNLRPLLLLPPIALGVAGYIWMTQPDETTAASTAQEQRLAVRVMTVRQEQLTVSAEGYGRVEPVRSWSAVSQVDGRVTDVFGDLAEGTLVEDGVTLIQVDQTDYDLAIRKSTANIAAAEATLLELERQEANSQSLLEVEERILDVAQAEYDRVSNLVERGTSTAAALDTAQKTLLAQETSVTNLNNTLALYPAQRASAEATLAVRQAELAEAQRGLANTTIVAPYHGRVSDKSVQVGQFIRTGEQLLTIDAVDQFEVVGLFQPNSLGSVIEVALGGRFEGVAEVDVSRLIEYLNAADIEASVVMEFAGEQARFPAELVRFRGSIDNETGTVGFAVRVDDPLIAAADRNRPPLQIGTFVTVVLESRPSEALIAIPRAAVHQNDAGQPFVYTVDAETRLAITPIVPTAVSGDTILVAEGLVDGDLLVLSMPRPPIEGLALTPIPVAGESQ